MSCEPPLWREVPSLIHNRYPNMSVFVASLNAVVEKNVRRQREEKNYCHLHVRFCVPSLTRCRARFLHPSSQDGCGEVSAEIHGGHMVMDAWGDAHGHYRSYTRSHVAHVWSPPGLWLRGSTTHVTVENAWMLAFWHCLMQKKHEMCVFLPTKSVLLTLSSFYSVHVVSWGAPFMNCRYIFDPFCHI